ncbi:hypothetical protein SKAU_G00275240 [Synaphobranchus kaupii]|uniref:Uncharacterized protein n=1 Tax=Synaphobranchus kaupii TaxID=118154 RepID=A0A9Q1F1B4_SYNKA|nr:hypothetical protein SKAU_G00275240 [Synaphobranchus kaupii]
MLVETTDPLASDSYPNVTLPSSDGKRPSTSQQGITIENVEEKNLGDRDGFSGSNGGSIDENQASVSKPEDTLLDYTEPYPSDPFLFLNKTLSTAAVRALIEYVGDVEVELPGYSEIGTGAGQRAGESTGAPPLSTAPGEGTSAQGEQGKNMQENVWVSSAVDETVSRSITPEQPVGEALAEPGEETSKQASGAKVINKTGAEIASEVGGENGAPMANLTILVLSGKCQSSCTALGCEHRTHYRTSGPHATLIESVSDSLVRNMHTSSPLEVIM